MISFVAFKRRVLQNLSKANVYRYEKTWCGTLPGNNCSVSFRTFETAITELSEIDDMCYNLQIDLSDHELKVAEMHKVYG